jgi:uncharacterized protein with von Willebrand factor type A (vWA) domain
MPELDLAALAVAFARAVRDGGIPSTPERTVRFAQALALADPTHRAELYWTARTIFVSSREQIPTFDSIFARVFDGLVDPADTRADRSAPPLPAAAEPGPRPPLARATAERGLAGAHQGVPGIRERGDATEQEAPEHELSLAAASADERLAERDFAELDTHELLVLRRLMRELLLATPARLSRRSRRDRRGNRLDLRATLRASCRTGGDPARRVRRRRQLVPRRLIVLCDISGSMEAYTRAFVQFLHSAVGGADAEAFVFATRLTRITRELRSPHADLAIARAAAAAPDWSSGTRIADALHEFNHRFGRRGMAHGAIVVILSDGLERGDPADVAREMERLRRMAYRIVWVNPRKAAPDYAPLAGGMAAALPLCDAFLAGNTLRALSAVADAIAERRGSSRDGARRDP